MASKAKRLRQKLVREGKMDPIVMRGSWHGVNPVERKPERPQIEMRRKEEKYRGRLIRKHEWDAFSFSAFPLMKTRIHR
ncbi:hypothetical protein [Brevibacillus migulae]|uniref:hypothetical protein n=1 Tax=Brevibacillus migulae TaxID=1644114 RepID=UPI00106EF97A|nr:hypothetical protein [Brevibacillus migulae]